MSNSRRSEVVRSIRWHLLLGLTLIVLVAGGVGGWAARTEISGAVIAPAAVIVDSNVKQVQHPSGGTVETIHARDGDLVSAGDILIKLDATIARARLAIVDKRLVEFKVRQARLWAERDGAEEMAAPRLSHEELAAAEDTLKAERRLFDLRKQARSGFKLQLRERIAQLKAEIEGLAAQVASKRAEIVLMQRELESARTLWKKKLMPISKITALEREATRLDGQRAQLITKIAATRGRIAETELQIIQIDRNLASEVARELRQIDATMGELVERQVASRDQLQRTEVRAPQSGAVHRSKVHTIGGVIGAGETVMMIVPSSDKLMVEAQVAPRDIDQLFFGQQALLRFSAFNQRTTPEIEGKIENISADVTVDDKSDKRYYTVRISVAADDVNKLGDVKLVPGMPVEAFIRTKDRTVLSYLVKPLSDQVQRAFRE